MKKRNKVLVILGVIFMIIGVAILLIGYWLSGADVLAWFTSKWAGLVYTILGFYLLTALTFFINDWIRKL